MSGSPLVTRRAALAACAALPFVRPAGAATAPVDGWPSRPIQFIVPFTAGSIGDLFVRPVAQLLGERLGQPIVVDNKAGASQAIGGEFAARAAPDGHTLFLGSQSGLVLNRIARRKLPFDPVADFAPVSLLFTTPMYLFVNKTVSAQSVRELIAMARAKPGKLTYASIGRGTSSHLAGELFSSITNTEMLHVPFKGGPQAMTAVAANDVDIMFNGGNAFPFMHRGQVRVLGSGGVKRTTALPDVPTLNEAGLPGFELVPWFGAYTQAAVPRPIVERLNRELTALVTSPAMREKALHLGVEVAPSTPEELARLMRDDLPAMTKIMRKAGIEAE